MKIIAHRGASAHAPENTLASFQMALDAGAEGLEFDVQLSRDGVPVVIHDDTLVRTGRRPERVADLTAKKLQSIDVGSWFNSKFPARAKPKFATETISTLERVLRSIERSAGLIYIELKCNATNFREVAGAVCNVIRESSAVERMIIKSFKLAAIAEIRHLMPSIQTAALFAPEVMHFLRRREHMIALAREFDVHQLSVHYSLVTPRLCALASEAKMPLTVWTVDDPRWIARRRALPIGALITNDPARLLSFRN